MIGCAIAALSVAPGRSQTAPEQAAPQDQIVVTANRRSESVEKVPQSIVALTGANLRSFGAQSFTDYFNKVPSLNFSSGGTGQNRFSIRGVAPLSSQGTDIATVGYYLDETPISETGFGADVPLFDIDRVEVLRGPQGTLYGEGSIGGTIRVITSKPDVTHFAAAVQGTGSATHKGDGNYDLDAMVNVPLVSDTLALRVVGQQRRDGGYIDNVLTGQDNANYSDRTNVRAALRYTPDSRLTVDLSGFFGREKSGQPNTDFSRSATLSNAEGLGTKLGVTGSPYVPIANPLNDLQSAFPFPQSYLNKRYIGSLVFGYDLGFAQLTSATSYYDFKFHSYVDDRETAAVVEGAGAQLGLPLVESSGVPTTLDLDNRVFSQEVRLVSKEDHPLRWLVGAFYRHRRNHYVATQFAPDLGKLVGTSGSIYTADQTVSFDQIAVFGEATYDITSRLHLTGGLRAFREKVEGDGDFTLINTFSPSAPLLSTLAFSTAARQTQKDVLFKASLNYDFGRDVMGYFLFSQASRPGGVNQRLIVPYLPSSFKSDSTDNFEVGLKAQLFDHRLTVNASVFQIDWHKTQIYVSTIPGGENIYNIPDGSRIRGAELELTGQISPALQVGGSAGYLDTHTNGPTTVFDSPYAPTTTEIPGGQELPNVPHWKGNAYAQYSAPLGADTTLTPRVDYEHVGKRVAVFGSTQRLDPYDIVNLRLTLARGPYSAALFVENLTDARAETALGAASRIYYGVNVMRPRTIGVTLNAAFR
ncbi:TonB-dependent receptor [Sphingomonas oryzagri]